MWRNLWMLPCNPAILLTPLSLFLTQKSINQKVVKLNGQCQYIYCSRFFNLSADQSWLFIFAVLSITSTIIVVFSRFAQQSQKKRLFYRSIIKIFIVFPMLRLVNTHTPHRRSKRKWCTITSRKTKRKIRKMMHHSPADVME